MFERAYRRRLRWTAVTLVLPWLASCVGGGAAATAVDRSPLKAEYALRWKPSAGGPKTAAEVLENLSLTPSKQAVDFEISYFQPVENLSAGNPVIRRRAKKNSGATELTYKLRPDAQQDAADAMAAPWPCPLGAAPADFKSELDVSFGADGESARQLSRSCTIGGPGVDAVLDKVAKRGSVCSASMRRYKAAAERLELKIEEWTLPGSEVLLEVSGSTVDSEAARQAFLVQVVQPLLSRGVRPVLTHKTLQAGNCQP